MKIALIGLPGSGKTTIFNTLTGLQADIGSFAKGKREPNIGTVKVPDERLTRLTEILHPKKTTPIIINFIDIAREKSDRPGSGFDPQTIARMREMDALAAVIQDFDNPQAPHPSGSINPLRDARTNLVELILADMVVVEKRVERKRKEGAKDREMEILKHCLECLEQDRPLKDLNLSSGEEGLLRGYQFLTLKPMFAVINRNEERFSEPLPAPLDGYLSREFSGFLPICGKMEMEISQLPPDEQSVFLQELGLEEFTTPRFVRTSYEVMDLICFFTVVSDDLRAWTIRKGTSALEAAGKIHTDIQRGFIRAEVIHFEELMQCGSFAKAREQGKLRLEGKEYPVQDGEIITFRFNI